MSWSQIRNVVLPLILLALAGCGAAVHGAAPDAATLAADFSGAPPPLAALHRHADALLTGGERSFARELRALHGYPLVVNKWASWCPPCRAEFPIFQRVAPQYARRVAFLGDDVNDTDGRSWLQRFPVSYPSFLDRSGTINDALGPAAASYTPVTYFFDRAGRQVYAHFGPYLSAASLRRDIHDFLGA